MDDHQTGNGTSDEYQLLVNQLRDATPAIASALERATQSRIETLKSLSGDIRLTGLEILIALFRAAQDKMNEDETLKTISFLVSRIIADFEMAIEAYLSGINAIVFDAMRDVLEVQYLLTDFTDDPTRINVWLSSDDDQLLRQFGTNTLRTRHANKLGVRPQDLATSTDYKGHSKFLHVTPRSHPFGSRGIIENRTFAEANAPFWDMFRHGEFLIDNLLQLNLAVRNLDNPALIFSQDVLKLAARFLLVSDATAHQEKDFFIEVLGPDYRRGPAPRES